MNEGESNPYLQSRYRHQVHWYDKKAIWNHRAYTVLQTVLIVLSAITPILIAIGDGWLQ